MDKDIISKISQCKRLQGKSVFDIVETDEYQRNLAAYWEQQRDERKVAREYLEALRVEGKTNGRLPAHVIDDLSDLCVEDLATEYVMVVARASRRPRAQREYIRQIGQQAYNLTIVQMIVEEFPELKETLMPGSDGRD